MGGEGGEVGGGGGGGRGGGVGRTGWGWGGVGGRNRGTRDQSYSQYFLHHLNGHELNYTSDHNKLREGLICPLKTEYWQYLNPKSR